mgnify:FL=1
MQTYLNQLNGQLNQASGELANIEGLIKEKEIEIEEIKVALEKAKENSKEQYEAMKERIQFMYERGNAAYLELFFSAESFGDFLNKTEYVEKLTEYDRQMLENYVSLQEQIAKDEQALIDEKDALDVLREEALKKKEEW